jgi:hypothetical protein
MNIADLLTSLMVFAYVLVVMAAVVVAISVLAKIADRPAPAAKEPDSDSDEVSPEIIAVLTAAAMETLGQPVAIHSARLHRDADHPSWASAGRIDIMLSHRVGPRR